jgi:Na+/proline symporter
MTIISWLIVLIPLAFIMSMGFYARRYVRDVSDFLASGRVAGRYVICVGDMAAGLSVITLVAMCEQNYQIGLALGFWNALIMPVGIFISLSGYCLYRFRQTRCLSAGQFLEMRYSRKFRIVACSIRTLAEMVVNAIGPAVAVRFFIYFIGIKPSFEVFGLTIPTYGVLVVISLTLAVLLILPAGRISLLLTDCIQGILSYPIFVIFTVFILTRISWFADVAPVMLDRQAGESFLNPMDISQLRDFNLFALVVNITATILNRAAWIGNDTSGSGRNPHEQKMAGILGTWRNGFAQTMLVLIAIYVITFMLGGRFREESHEVRLKLTAKVAEEVIKNPETRTRIQENVAQLPVEKHEIGVDAPYSRKVNPDTKFLDTIHETILKESADEGTGNASYQQFKTLYGQMMMPVMLGVRFTPVLMGLFTLMMVMLLLSTDNSRIFNAASTIIQDVVLPLRKSPLSVLGHLKLLKQCTVYVAVFFLIVSLFFAQLDYINMFITIMCSVWLGAAGPIMVGGLYTRFGTTQGAWSALAVGSGIPTFGLFVQRNWPDIVYPWLDKHGYVEPVGKFLEAVSGPFNPFIVWKMDAVKFPINSYEVYFMAMISGCIAYGIVSFLTLKEPFNLDRMLHRGAYAEASDDADVHAKPVKRFWLIRIIMRIVGIDKEYTKGDKIIAWSVFSYALVYNFGIMFVGVVIWNLIAPWPPERWAIYFFITTIVTAISVGCVSTIWFMWGGIRDATQLMRDLEARVANPLDDGSVQGHVSRVDIARFEQIEKELHVHDHDEEEKKD